VKSRYDCKEPSCERGRATGHPIYRTSEKGQPFEGACAEHYTGPLDTLVKAISTWARP